MLSQLGQGIGDHGLDLRQRLALDECAGELARDLEREDGGFLARVLSDLVESGDQAGELARDPIQDGDDRLLGGVAGPLLAHRGSLLVGLGARRLEVDLAVGRQLPRILLGFLGLLRRLIFLEDVIEGEFREFAHRRIGR